MNNGNELRKSDLSEETREQLVSLQRHKNGIPAKKGAKKFNEANQGSFNEETKEVEISVRANNLTKSLKGKMGSVQTLEP